MKALTLGLLLALPLGAGAAPSPPPGVHGTRAPEAEPMKTFAWRDDAAGYSFVGPPRWAGRVKAVPVGAKDLAASGATSGVTFIDTKHSQTLLILLATDNERAATMLGTESVHELARSGDHVVARKDGPTRQTLVRDEMMLTPDELDTAIRWDSAAGTTAR
ncbi:hypothetical protein EC912_103201 [Luteibacter rhizovicinus]|uniref:Uncharacterized protein n=1 Tax=Luteibacter rhizovicinus TaxID=242606 RepID=A0A4R3YQR9_9GAMM|nr:hypothetical protein [Luteibacter rhizovicinus]TCV94716.1 hypothetical protein EC912_103201 [Luteibacter rhizovicinus]